MNLKNVEEVVKYSFISKLKGLPFVQKVILFGSRARGTHQRKSDIDLAIVSSGITSEQWHEVLEIVENADTLLLIDCLNFDRADVELKKRILKDGIEL